MRVLCRRTNKEYTKYCLAYSLFQSPSSVWRTTLYRRCAVLRGRDISIHVLRVEDDAPSSAFPWPRANFNPRPPCGGRPSGNNRTDSGAVFQSTSSVWRTTAVKSAKGKKSDISIHVLRVEDDCRYSSAKGKKETISIHVLRVEDDVTQKTERRIHDYFIPRTPCGGRPCGH